MFEKKLRNTFKILKNYLKCFLEKNLISNSPKDTSKKTLRIKTLLNALLVVE